VREINPLAVHLNILYVYHLCVVKMDFKALRLNRASLFIWLREKEIAVNVHHIPVYLHPFYRDKFNTRTGLCPNTEGAYDPGYFDGNVSRHDG